MASIKEVAKEAGVSVATVSYVLNKNKYVSPELTKRVLQSVQKLNYNANPLAYLIIIWSSSPYSTIAAL